MERDDRGAAVADFVMVTGLVLFLFLIVFQVGLTLHTRNVLTSLASEGARYGAAADVTRDVLVEQRTVAGISSAFNGAYATRSRVVVDLRPEVAVVTITAPMPLLFFPTGPMEITVRGHALEERRP